MNKTECGEHDGTGWPCPTCDICGGSQCHDPEMEWNGETGNHTACENDAANMRTVTFDVDGTAHYETGE